MKSHPLLTGGYEYWKNKTDSYSYELKDDDLKAYFNAINNSPGYSGKYDISSLPSRIYHYEFYFNEGALFAFSLTPFPTESSLIFKRFAGVFGQTYRRYLDLQKAEAQAREAHIEVSLERVRARAMAMHKTDELLDAAELVYKELSTLGFASFNISYAFVDKEEKYGSYYSINPVDGKIPPFPFLFPHTETAVMRSLLSSWKTREPFHVIELDEEATVNHQTYIGEHIYRLIIKNKIDIPFSVESFLEISPKTAVIYSFNFTQGYLFIIGEERLSTAQEQIALRFTKVFELTYRRFLDLTQAEAQAREAKIEAALEKVRSNAMAMHNSADLAATIKVFYQQLGLLNLMPRRCGVGLIDKETHIADLTGMVITEKGETREIAGQLKLSEHPVLINIYENWLAQKEYHPVLRGNEIRDYYHRIGAQISVQSYPDDAVQFGNFFFFPEGTVYAWAEKVFTEDELKIYRRFTAVLSLTYKRYKDLTLAEAQAKEARIEAALERVRSKAMAMHRSHDLAETIGVFYRELSAMSITPRRCGVGLLDKATRIAELSTMNTTPEGESIEIIGKLKMEGHPVLEGVFDGWLKQKEYHPVLRGIEIKEYYQLLRPQIGFPDYPDDAVQYGYFFYFTEGGVYAWTEKEMSEDELQIYRRFTSVLSLTYKRYRDLMQAEANAREARIEAALEKVRSRSLAMHKSDELLEVIMVVAEQLQHLDIKFDNVSFGVNNEDYDINFWMAARDYPRPLRIHAPYLDSPVINRIRDAIKNHSDFFADQLDQSENNQWILHLSENAGVKLTPEAKEYITSRHGYARSTVILKNIFFFIGNYLGQPYTDEVNAIFKRFANVFDQSYTRFLDLQKAEAQAMEARIEAGLERVRARTMAMHSSEDVSLATATMLAELEKLDIQNLRGGILNIRRDETMEVWSINTLDDGSIVRAVGDFDMKIHPFWRQLYAGWKSKDDYAYFHMIGKDKEDYISILDARRDYLPNGMHHLPDSHVQSYFFDEGAVWSFSLEPHTEENKQVMKRFAAVFSLTFRRYQDLKKAELQAREAKIEAAMEKVRARAMAMQKPGELMEVAQLLRKEMGLLGVEELETSSIYIHDEATGTTECWYAIQDIRDEARKLVTDHMTINLNDTWVGREMLRFYRSAEKQTSIVMKGENRIEWINYCTQQSKVFKGYHGDTIPERTYHLLKFSNGYMGAASPGDISAESWELLKRATNVFSLAYTRFNDLQLAEANAKEAVKQAALDRVRAEIASMRTVGDLERITPLIWNELTILGIPFIRCGVFIMDEAQQTIHTFLSTPDGKAIAAFHLPYSTPGNISLVLSHWHNKKIYVGHWDESSFRELSNILVQQGAIVSQEQYLSTLPQGGFYLHFLPFLQGMLYVGNTTQLGDDDIKLIQHVADAFSTAYARYEDFNRLEAAKQQVEQTLTDLKQAQTQLVQSEKMASLGELTAGIAHEIQNPLNFVNNFSDVSNELLQEMKSELEKGNAEDAMAIAEDVKQNLEKILHHGRRADAIVKGMLQHSRASSGQKELTDINLLADEYLRLAFHGLRAKDKSFNAKFETDFDSTLEKINVVPQEIGRVILNLINNAFYAVSEKKKQVAERYEPIVTVSTRKSNGKISISVIDNGIGIPQKSLDKIFQPFFTTKPTSQGTGLGLSLAYDIVTKGHGGELKVETKEGEGTEFIVSLPG